MSLRWPCIFADFGHFGSYKNLSLLQTGTEVMVMPSGEVGSIKSITTSGRRTELARAGDSADVTLSDVDTGVLGAGAHSACSS